MRRGPRRHTARDFAAIDHEDTGAFKGEFIGSGYSGDAGADDEDVAFGITSQLCRVGSYLDVHPYGRAAPIGKMAHAETR